MSTVDLPGSNPGTPGPTTNTSMYGPVHRHTSSSTAARSAFPKQLSEKYRLGEELGRGAYGQVYMGLDARTGQHVAIKQISLDRIPAGALAGIVTEVELLKALNHPNVVAYLGSFRTRSHLYIIMELVECGSLAAAVKASRCGPLPEALVAVHIQQVLDGLTYLHSQGVVHRDIKGANILTTREGVAKLADFGVAARLGEGAAMLSGDVAQPAGTPYWMAPEVVELKTVTTASDVWSVGCLAVELFSGHPPYFELQPLSALYNIVQDQHPPLPPGSSALMHDFLLHCFKKEPSARPSAKTLLNHPWISTSRRALRSTWYRSLKGRSSGELASVIERILEGNEATSSGDSSGSGTPTHTNGGELTPPLAPRTASGALPQALLGDAEEAARQQEFIIALDSDSTGSELLKQFDALSIGINASPVAAPPPSPINIESQDTTHAARDEGEVRRQIMSLRVLAAPGERSLIEEAAAAASARALIGILSKNMVGRAAFIAADGMSSVRELLDSPSERLLLPIMDCLLALVEHDVGALELSCALGIAPAALRFAGSQHPTELRIRSSRFATALSRSSAGSAHMLVACQGVPFFMTMMDESPQTPEQLELLEAAANGFWGLLRRSRSPGWPLRTNAYLRLMAHHGLPQRLVKALPWVLKHASVDRSAHAHHTRSASAPPAQSGVALSHSGSASSLRSVQSQGLGGLRPSNRVVPEEAVLLQGAPTDNSKSIEDANAFNPQALLESLVYLFGVLTHGDAVVKIRCCQTEAINAMFGLTVRMPSHLQLVVLQSVKRLSAESSALSSLEKANAVAYVAAQLPRTDAPALQAEALCVLHNLCQLSRQRQDAAAAAGVVPWLCRLALQPPASEVEGSAPRAAAVAVLCSFAHCSPRTRAEMWAHGGFDVLLQLLKEDVHAAAVLEALAAWLDAELPRIEGRILEETSLPRIVLILPQRTESMNDQALLSVLSPLSRLLARSTKLAVALASAGLATRVVELLKRPSPPAALALMDVLRVMYEAHPRPKEFIAAHRVVPALGSLAQPSNPQVLVRNRASSLLQAFSVNAVF